VSRPGALSWASSLLVLVLLASGCGKTDEIVYPPPASTFTILPPDSKQYDHVPTVSADASVLAWVRVWPTELDAPPLSRILWTTGSRTRIDTLLTLAATIDQLDLSADGRRLLALISPTTSRPFLMLWTDQQPDTPRAFPLDFSGVRTPRWLGDSEVLFGATGPEGGGVYRWDLATDRVAPVSVRFGDTREEWNGGSPGIDRSGTRVCMERRAQRTSFEATVRAVDSGELIYSVVGNSPHFFNIIPEEEDGLLYLDRLTNLWAIRISTKDIYPIAAGVYEYDVSDDGRWLFVHGVVPFLGPGLLLRDLRELRESAGAMGMRVARDGQDAGDPR
jgi:hypothetical protein